MADKKYTWHKIADHITDLEFADNNMAAAELNGKKICVGKFKEELFAFAWKCPHAGGLLADGYIDALGNVVCPLHMQNGSNVSGEDYELKQWPVETRDDGIYVSMEKEGGFWNIFK